MKVIHIRKHSSKQTCLGLLLALCAHTACLQAQDQTTTSTELFPHVRIIRPSATGPAGQEITPSDTRSPKITHAVIEIDGFIPIDCHNPQTPDVYLEVIVCAVDSREHESLVATRAKASDIHAALLAAGFYSGAPGAWIDAGPSKPTGDPLRIELIVPSQPDLPTDPKAWIRSVEREQSLLEWEAANKLHSAWVFAGSRFVQRGGREVYAADGTGQIIGLHTFGSETIAWTTMLSPQADVEEPEWIAANAIVPVVRTPVIVRISRLDQAQNAHKAEKPDDGEQQPAMIEPDPAIPASDD